MVIQNKIFSSEIKRQAKNVFPSDVERTVTSHITGPGEWMSLDVSVNSLIFLGRCLFVCVEALRPSQPNGVMSSAVSLPNHTFTGQA